MQTKFSVDQANCTSNDDTISGITVDSSGNSYVVGSTRGSMEVIIIRVTGLFFNWFNSNGDQQWLIQKGTPNADIAKDAEIDTAGNIFVTGQTSGGLINLVI